MDAFLSSFFAPDGATTTSKNKGDGITTSPALPPQDSNSSQCPSLADLSSSSFSSSSSSSSSSLSFSSTADGVISDSNSNTSSDFNGDYSLSVLLPKRKMFGCASSSSSGDDDNHRHDLYPIDELLDHDDNPTDEDGNHDHDGCGGGEGIREGYDAKEETTPGGMFLETKSEHKDILTVSVVQHEKGVNICSVVNQMHSNSRSNTNQKDLSSTVCANNNEPKNDEEPNVLSRVGEEPTSPTDDVTPKSNRVKKSKKKNAKKGKKNRRASIDGSVDGYQSTLAPTSDAKGKTVQTRRVKKKKPKAAGTISSSPPPSILVSAESKQSVRKSSSSNRRNSNSVSFYPRVRIHRVPKRCHLSEELMDAIWYSVHDFRSFRQDCYDTMYRMMKLDEVDPMDVEDRVKDETSMDEINEHNDDNETRGGGGRLSPSSSLPSIFFDEEGNDYCRRGLELRVNGLQDGRQRRKKKVRDIVTAQQTFEDVTGMETDPIFLASLLRPHSKACVELAIKAAECDAEEACLIHFEEMNDQEKQNL